MNIIQQMWYKIVSSDNGPLLATIKTQKESLKARNEEISRANQAIAQRNDSLEKLRTQENVLYKQIVGLKKELEGNNKNSSLANYKQWLDANVRPKSIKYDFGSGSKRVHTIFKDSIKDEGIIRTFTKDDLGFDGSKYATADNLVYSFNTRFSAKFKTSRYYDSDKALYGVLEYWALAKQTIALIRKGGKAFDCDDSMTLRYSCLYYLLKDFFPNEMWRLRGFIVDIWTGGGHAMLAWVKEGPNDWVPIETTFYDREQSLIWKNDYVIGTQMLYQIRYSFDNITEYEK